MKNKILTIGIAICSLGFSQDCPKDSVSLTEFRSKYPFIASVDSNKVDTFTCLTQKQDFYNYLDSVVKAKLED
jgi:hypothetical protein|tara:strand:+ start:758 stop:976 length:219 start_codon:yes stop_codon:yes gene_type:complete